MKKIFCIAVTVIMLVFFLLAPELALSASRRGLMLWFEQLLPTLLPFTVLSYVILQSHLLRTTGEKRDSSKISTEEWYIIFCGFLFGFPIGSKLTADLYSQNRISKERASVLFVFTNNLGPVYVTSAFQALPGDRPLPCTYLLLYGIPFAYGMLRLHKASRYPSVKQKNTASGFQLNMQIIDAGIINGFETLIKICGYVILFSLTAEIIKQCPLPATVKSLLIGCTEVTNGMAELSAYTDPSRQYIYAMLFLSWGGISGLAQTASIVSRTDLSMKKYLIHRLCMTGLTVLGACLLFILGIC